MTLSPSLVDSMAQHFRAEVMKNKGFVKAACF